MAGAYERITQILEMYLSPINARGALTRALRRLDLGEHNLGDAHVLRLFDAMQPALRLYLNDLQRSNLSARLREEFKQGAAPVPQTLAIQSEDDVSRARMMARSLCLQMGARSFVVQKVATIVSELARNIILYAGQGTIELKPVDNPAAMVVRAADRGAGIPHLHVILGGAYHSKTGLGLGLLGCKRMSDRFEIETGAGGTRIEAQLRL